MLKFQENWNQVLLKLFNFTRNKELPDRLLFCQRTKVGYCYYRGFFF